MSKERYAEHTVAWELPNGDSVTKSNYNLADIGTKYIPIPTEIISDNKDKIIAELQQRIAELEEQLKSLADYTKQVRKEVIEEIRALAIKRNDDQFYIMIDEILEKIGEEEWKD
jgi:DNA-binding ferritin-like protein